MYVVKEVRLKSLEREMTGKVCRNFLGWWFGHDNQDGDVCVLSACWVKHENLYFNTWNFVTFFGCVCSVLYVLVSEGGCASSFGHFFPWLPCPFIYIFTYLFWDKVSLSWSSVVGQPQVWEPLSSSSPSHFWSFRHWQSYLPSPVFRFSKEK